MHSCKPNQGKLECLYKTCNEKYNDCTNKIGIGVHICDKLFVSRKIESDSLSRTLFQAHLTQSVPLNECIVSYTRQIRFG